MHRVPVKKEEGKIQQKLTRLKPDLDATACAPAYRPPSQTALNTATKP
jgi:hypothetical protein